MPRAIATPIPALAPVESPLCRVLMEMSVFVGLAPVRTDETVEVVPPAHNRVVLDEVHIIPLLQQPPPWETAQLNWSVPQPLGDGVEALGVWFVVAMQPLLVAQMEPTEQHPPPYMEAQ